MKLGAFTACFPKQPLSVVLDTFQKAGLKAVEVGTGCWPGDSHLAGGGQKDDKQTGLRTMLRDHFERARWMRQFKDRELEISALSCHGNPVHPNPKIARNDEETLLKTMELAGFLAVKTVVCFSGCPGEGPNATKPNWVTCPWPPEFLEILEYQWQVLVPKWAFYAKVAHATGVNIAIEMHPGFCVYGPESLLKLREAVREFLIAELGKKPSKNDLGKANAQADRIGANVDPSHLFWQGIDPIQAVKMLGKAIHYVHAKDTKIDSGNMAVVGCLDVKHYADVPRRSWVFRTVGIGHGRKFWVPFIDMLTSCGYHGFISIEHEDGQRSAFEGLMFAIKFLQGILPAEEPSAMTWA